MKIIEQHELDVIKQKKSNNPFFEDNIEYLEALEDIAILKLMAAIYRNNDPLLSDIMEFTLSYENQMKEKVKNANEKGVQLSFEKFCSIYNLDNFERTTVQLLLFSQTSKRFREFLPKYKSDHHNDYFLTIDDILAIISLSYRDQIINRKYFSVDGRLVKYELIDFSKHYRNFFYTDVSLHERIINFIVGDNNIYDVELQGIMTEKSNIKWDQVVLPAEKKSEILEIAQNYAANKLEKANYKLIEEFYGYGTGIVFLFYGPSGTGKTMLAYALANELDKSIVTIKSDEENCGSMWRDSNIIKHTFREAKLCNGIVFFDECDDLFKNDTLTSRTFLIELEKAKCITILATNKPIQMDPALDRRVTMKVPFYLPDEFEREKIWKILIPPNIKIASNVNIRELAKKYIFAGGQIKNALFMAINNAMARDNFQDITLNYEGIEKSAEYQTITAFELNGLSESYTPEAKIHKLLISSDKKTMLSKIASAYKKSNGNNKGINILIGSSNIESGIQCANAVAKACDLKV
ncbi:MAG: ATP-binding protein, partial [Desulfobacterales bacterium]|nr:ATP-binding protein [Desulfobacterales bacterium]